MNASHNVKVERLLLVNYLPLFLTTGLNRIEIDWRNTDEMLTLIVGMNGSGKTILLTEISPDPYEGVAYRSKHSLKIIPGTDGLKELDLLVDGKIRYKCSIIQPDKGNTKASITKENISTGEIVELNPNGNISSYMDILDIELGFNKNYINIGYLTDGISDFITMKPTERNNYISSWLPSISEYLESHKIVSKNKSIIKRQLDLTNTDIAKIISVDYDIEISNLNSSIDDIEINLENINKNITKGETYLSLLNKQPSSSIRSSISELQHNHIRMCKDRNELVDFQNSLLKYRGEVGLRLLYNEIEQNNLDIQLLKQDIQNLDSLMVTLRSKIQEYQTQDYNIQENLPDISDLIDKLNISITETDNIISNYERDYPEFKNNGLKDISQKIDSILDTIRHFWTKLRDNSSLDVVIINDVNRMTKTIDDNINTLQGDENRIQNIIIEMNQRIYLLKNNGINPKILENKPHSCQASTCPIIKELLNLISPENEILNIQHQISQNLIELDKINQKLIQEEDKKLNIINSFKIMDDINHIIYENKEIIGQLPEEIRNIINKDTIELMKDFIRVQKTFSAYKEYSSITSMRDIYIERMETLMNKKKLISLKLESQEESRKSLEKFNETLSRRQSAINELEYKEKTINFLNDVKTRSSSFQDISNQFNREIAIHNTNRYNILKTTTEWYYASHIEDILINLRKKRNNLTIELNEKRSRRENIQSKILTIKSLESRRDELTKQFKTYELFEKIWSPKVGYPALRIKDFLTDIKERSNKDLQSMWGGSLQIKEFDMKDGEFSIPIIRGGNSVISDASLCSDGERATLALTISIAILESHNQRNIYNVVRLDEVDAKLDEARRRGFLTIITDRLKEMGCASCFAVTHNNEFDFIPANIIIMPGQSVSSANLSNKTILFQA